jgi:hypothetical protein
MTGLSNEMEADCRDIHQRFLDEHGLSEWPVKIAVEPTITITPRMYTLTVKAGVGGPSRMTLTTSPRVDLRRNLDRQLEIDYQNQQKKKSTSGT